MTIASPSASRVERARRLLDELELDGLLVSRNAAKRHLSGFVIARGDEATSGFSGSLLLTRDRQLLLSDPRYLEQAASEAPDWQVRRTRGPIRTELPPILAELGIRRCGAEAEVLSHAAWTSLAAASAVELVPIDAVLTELRLRKDPAELRALEAAAALTDACFAHLVGWLSPGTSERAVAWEIERWFREHGAEDLAFEPIVLVGARAAMPHGRPGDAPVVPGEPLLIDFGCQVDGYRTDVTRTVFIGEPSGRQRELYATVLAAQQAAFEAVAPGVVGTAVDGAARAVIDAAGFGEAFTHGIGHGIGLETHEAPMLLSYDRPLEAGMVFTLEPGIYLSGEIGIRIEDDVVVEEGGPRRLTGAPHDLLVI